jgi:S-methylmethionine-dependent homocysteine/selenocysteine methylase
LLLFAASIEKYDPANTLPVGMVLSEPSGNVADVTILILDGAMGTELIARGVPAPSPGWSAQAIDSAPNVVATIHRAYAAAGARVHTANTFRTKRRQLGERWKELARRAVAIARAAVPVDHVIAGSIAPLEDCYRPDLSPAEPRREHRELARVLADAGADVLLCETFANTREAAIAVEEAVATGKPTWAALTAGPDGALLTPAELERGARECVARGAEAVLVNCVAAERTLAYVERLREIGRPFGAYANFFGRSAPAEDYALFARSWVDTGASMVGGCCGTGPAHVAALARLCLR